MSKTKKRGNSILRNDKNAFPRLKERGGEYYIHKEEFLKRAKAGTELLLSVISKVLSENHAIDPADFEKVLDKSFEELAGAKAS
tara:strand:- start:717 stop:968 length:252 start_codon:yes stop_codon:yes gene_type:complete